MNITPELLDELDRKAQAATPGPWLLVDGDWIDSDCRCVTTQDRIDGPTIELATIKYGHPEAGMLEPFQSEQVAAGEYIAAADPTTVLAMIATIRQQRAELERLQGAPAEVPDGWADAYAAFKGAFDSPVARWKIDDEYAADARRRLRDFNDTMLAAAPAAPAAAAQEPHTYWVLFDAEAERPFIKKMLPEGFLAFFECESDARRALARNPGTDYKQVDYCPARPPAEQSDTVKVPREVLEVLLDDKNSAYPWAYDTVCTLLEDEV